MLTFVPSELCSGANHLPVGNLWSILLIWKFRRMYKASLIFNYSGFTVVVTDEKFDFDCDGDLDDSDWEVLYNVSLFFYFRCFYAVA